MSLLSKKLKQAQSAWRDCETAEAGGSNGLPDGKYKVKISGAEMKEDKNGGVGILFSFEVTQGKHEGESQVKWCGVLDSEGELLSEDRIKWVKRDLASLLGEPVEDISELEDLLGDMLDKGTEIVVKTNKEGYTNTYINGKATESGDDDEDEDDEEDEDDTLKKKKAARDDDEDEDDTDDDDDADEDEEDDDEDEPAPKKGRAKKASEEEDAEEEVERLLNGSKKKKVVTKKRK